MKPTPASDRPVLIGHRPAREGQWTVGLMMIIGLCTSTLLSAQSLDLDSFNTANKIRIGQLDSSVITDLHRVRVLAAQAEEAEQLLLARKNLGGFYIMFQRLDSAKFHLDAGMKIELKDSLIAARASLFINSGVLADAMGFETTSYQQYLNALHICEYLGDSLKKAKVLLNLANIDFEFDRFELGIERLEQAIDMAGPEHWLSVWARSKVGAFYYEHGDTAQAKEHYLASIEAARANNDYITLNRCLINLGHLELETKNYAVAERLIKEALKLSEDNNNGRRVVDCHSKLGDLYQKQARYNEAIEQYKMALYQAKSTQSTDWIEPGIKLALLEISARSQADGELLLQETLEAGLASVKVWHRLSVIHGIHDACDIFLTKGDTLKAKEYYHLLIQKAQLPSLDMTQSPDLLHGIGLSFQKLGSIELQMGHLDEAQQFLRQAIDVFNKDSTQSSSAAAVHDMLGKAYEQESNAAMAIGEYDLAMEGWIRDLENKILGNSEVDAASSSSFLGKDGLNSIMGLIKLIDQKQKVADEQRRERDAEKRRNTIQYSSIFMALLFVLFILLFLGKLSLPAVFIEKGFFFTLLILFEFLLLLFDPHISKLGKGVPANILFINSILALLILPFHGFFEKLLKKRLQKTRD